MSELSRPRGHHPFPICSRAGTVATWFWEPGKHQVGTADTETDRGHSEGGQGLIENKFPHFAQAYMPLLRMGDLIFTKALLASPPPPIPGRFGKKTKNNKRFWGRASFRRARAKAKRQQDAAGGPEATRRRISSKSAPAPAPAPILAEGEEIPIPSNMPAEAQPQSTIRGRLSYTILAKEYRAGNAAKVEVLLKAKAFLAKVSIMLAGA
jgi:hypothetical protein